MKKTIALLSYLSWPGWIAAALLFSTGKEKDPYARFHLRQAFGLALLALACYVVFLVFDYNLFYFSLPSLIVLIPLLVLWFMGFKSAMDETQRELPLVGRYFQRWFTFF